MTREHDDRLEVLPEPVLYAPEDRVTGCEINLEMPIQHGGETITQLRVSPITGLNVRRMPREFDRIDDFLELAELLTQLPETVLDQLGADDLGSLLGAVQGSLWVVLDMPNVARDDDGQAVPKPAPRLAVPFTLQLEAPITDDKARETVTELVFREVTGKVARTFPARGISWPQLPGLIEKLTGASTRIVDQLQGRDLRDALAAASCFFASIRATGRGSGVL